MQPRPTDMSTPPMGGGDAAAGEGSRPPAEGRPDLGVPGADREDEPLPDRNDDLPERLGERLENGSSSAVATGEPDVLPQVEPPDEVM